jgi:tetratricopeptide (TPR) repeat protein
MRARSLGAVAALACGLGCAPESAGPPSVTAGAARGYDVILVTLDTVRQDRLGCYGYEYGSTPTFDALAERGVRFEQAVTAAPLTLPSHATMMTGVTPPRHGVHDNGIYRLDEDNETFAEVARAAGYQTAAFVGCFVLDARFGLNQGFDVYDFDVSERGLRPQMLDFNERSANEVTDAALAWLGERDPERPYFLWVHYFDAHLPYQSPLAGEARFAGRPYDAEIAFVDREVGRLLEAVDPERSLVVVASDHGEALGDHGEPTHGLFLYESTVRVPLIVTGPFDPAVVDRVVGLVDLKPTLEFLVGFESEAEPDGMNLFAGAARDRAVYMETEAPIRLGGWSELAALRTDDRKYVEAPDPELYDLRADPAEAANLWSAGEGGAWRARVDSVRAPARIVASESLDADDRARLEALGYVQADVAEEEIDRPDPKSGLDAYLAALESESLYSQGRYAEAAELAHRAVTSNPDLVQAVRVLAFCHLRLGRHEEAIELLDRTTQRRPDPYLLRSFAQALIVDGRMDDARRVLDRYEAIAPRDGRVPLLRGDILVTEGKPEAAEERYREAKRRDPRRVGKVAEQRIQRLPSHGGH